MVTVPRTVNRPSGPRSPSDLRSIILKMTRNSRLCRRWSIDFLCMILKVIPKLSGRYTLSDNICFTFDPKAFLRGYNGRPLYLNWNIFASIVTFPKGSLSRQKYFETGIMDKIFCLESGILPHFRPKAGYNGRPLYLNWNIFASIVTFPKGSLSRHFTFEPGILDHQYTQPRVESRMPKRAGVAFRPITTTYQ